MKIHSALMGMVLLATGAGVAYGVEDLLGFLADHEQSFLLVEESEEDGDEWPTVTVEASAAAGGIQVMDFEVQGHTGGVDIESAKLVVVDAAGGDTCWLATFANGGVVLTPEGSKATFSGIPVPVDNQQVKFEWVCLGESYHRMVEDPSE